MNLRTVRWLLASAEALIGCFALLAVCVTYSAGLYERTAGATFLAVIAFGAALLIATDKV